MENSQMTYNFSIFDINFILVFIGFALITTFFPDVNSAIVSLCISFISLICLFKSGIKIGTISKEGKTYLALVFLIILRTAFDLYVGSLSDVSSYMKYFVMVFSIGVMLVPMLSIISSYNRINWRLSFLIIFIILFVIVGLGVANSSMNVTNNSRVNLNEKLGSIVFAENASYLMMLSLLHLAFPPFENRFLKNIIKIICVAGLVLSFYGFAKAASRGPFLAAFAVAAFFVYNNSRHFKAWLFVFIIAAVLGSATIVSSFKDFAPLLYDRIDNTIEVGDEERKLLADEGIEMFKESPIFGKNPLIVWEGGFTGRHNAFIDMALFLGVIGLVVYVLLVLKVLLKLKNLKQSDMAPLFFYMFFISCMIRSVTSFPLLKNAMFSVAFVMTCIFINTSLKI